MTIPTSETSTTRVGVYVDGFNLYYGMKSHFESDSSSDRVAGWRWLDVGAVGRHFAKWENATVVNVVYCTARLNDPASQQSAQRQDFYLTALKESSSVDTIEEGHYSAYAKEAVMTSARHGTSAPPSLFDLQHEFDWSNGLPIRRRSTDGLMFSRIRKREEKGSDVNVATHLLKDVLEQSIDAAIVITNDSDLALPLRIARKHVHVGLLNPQKQPLAGHLKGDAQEGVGKHWWTKLTPNVVLNSQLPDKVGKIRKPIGW